MTVQTADQKPPSGGFNIYDPKIRGIFYQVMLLVVLVWIVFMAGHYAVDNMARQNIPLNFDFLSQTAGFEINQTLVPYSAVSSYGRAFLVGLLNTLLVSAVGIVFATIIGFVVAVLRLSQNWIVSRIATVYVELFRNIPLLLQLVFWYNVVLKSLPPPRQSPVRLWLGVPQHAWHHPAEAGLRRRRGKQLGSPFSLGSSWRSGTASSPSANKPPLAASRRSASWALGLIVGLPLIAYLILGRPITFEVPQLKGFNFVGGAPVFPEFAALLLGLSIYTGAFISEIVRSGILAVGRGQHEAADALGIRSNVTMRLVVIPQSMRVVIPPLTNQYLNLIKNSSLAVFIGYPELVQVFAGTVLNQTGAAIQCMAITMAVYLVISLVTSAAMNAFNQRVALVER